MREIDLNRPQIFELLNTIITHGDLIDITFLEKIFDTKLSPQHYTALGADPNTQSLVYQTDEVFGDPIQMLLFQVSVQDQ